MKLFVGLGNPGKDYARHRHNVGFMALERIAERHGLGPWKKRYHGLVTEGPIGGRRVMLLMPRTYMNDSGQAVGEAQRYLKIAEGDIYVFHDDIDLAPGKLKVKVGGGNAGHNGLRSVSAHVGNDYARVRIGVGHPGDRDKVIGYVLHDFSRTDQAWLESMLDAIAGAAGRLAEGHGDRFATDVMRRLQGIQAVRRGAEDDPAALSARSGGRKATPAATPHPASRAERVADAPSQSSTPSANADGTRRAPPQRGGSLADHLKRWLRGRG